MMNIPMYQEAVYHFFSGMALSFADRYVSVNASRKTKERLERKIQQTEALNSIRDSMANEEADLVSYATVQRAREYFEDHNIQIALQESTSLKNKVMSLGSYLRAYKDRERLNNLSLGKKLGAAFCLEFVADAGVMISQIFFGLGNGVAAIGESLYQGPCLFLGAVAGKGVLNVKEYFTRSKEEKELDAMSKSLTGDGKLLDFVRNYQSSMKVPEVIEAEIVSGQETTDHKALPAPKKSVAEALIGIGGKVSGAYTGFRQKLRERKEARAKTIADAEEAHKRELRDKYKDY